MFAYVNPVDTVIFENEGALQAYRENVHTFYRTEARKPNSSFTLLSAFSDALNDPDTIISEVSWAAFPKISSGSDAEIDLHRFVHQDEYVEWRVERDDAGNITRITFTTELYEILESLAEVGEEEIRRGIQEIIPGAEPTTEELFGPDFAPEQASPDDRGSQFVLHRRMNPWNNGEKGILCLGHRNNTMGALFTLIGDCAINRHINPAQVCEISSCVPGRNSDPSICTACQQLTQSNRVISLGDPVGIRIKELGGIWKINGQQIDINDSATNGGTWTISRNGRRAVLVVGQNLTIGDDQIISGAQVSRSLLVEAAVISMPEHKAPAWAHTGKESSRMIV